MVSLPRKRESRIPRHSTKLDCCLRRNGPWCRAIRLKCYLNLNIFDLHLVNLNIFALNVCFFSETGSEKASVPEWTGGVL